MEWDIKISLIEWDKMCNSANNLKEMSYEMRHKDKSYRMR